MDEMLAKEDGKVYEIAFHIAPFVGEDKIAHEVSLIKGLLEKIGATTISEDFPRLKNLAYPLSKLIAGSKKTFKDAYFGWIKFETKGDGIGEFTKGVEKIENIIRYLIVKTVKENTLYGNKFATKYDGKAKVEGVKKAPEVKQEMVEVEVDKAIDELVV